MPDLYSAASRPRLPPNHGNFCIGKDPIPRDLLGDFAGANHRVFVDQPLLDGPVEHDGKVGSGTIRGKGAIFIGNLCKSARNRATLEAMGSSLMNGLPMDGEIPSNLNERPRTESKLRVDREILDDDASQRLLYPRLSGKLVNLGITAKLDPGNDIPRPPPGLVRVKGLDTADRYSALFHPHPILGNPRPLATGPKADASKPPIGKHTWDMPSAAMSP